MKPSRLRTVLLLDDEFPTFADLAQGETEGTKQKFRQKDRAVGLYRGFRSRHMICDVANQVGDLEIERFRKSDLIILDYHLGPDEDDSEYSIKLLRDLASSKHFNTVIVYTAEQDVDQVWLDVMATLSGGWTDFIPKLDGEASEYWDTLTEAEKLPGATREATMQYARRKSIRELDQEELSRARDELVQLGVPMNACTDIIIAMIHREMGRRAGRYAEEPHRATVGDYEDGVRWIQTRNSFVCILQKQNDENEDDQSERLMSYLSRALLAWRPNLFQILISEIQNVLELEALATADELLRDPTTHTALWYYLLETLGYIDPDTHPEVRAPLVDIINKVLDGVRRKLSTDNELLNLVSGALLGELIDTGWTRDTWPISGESTMAVGAEKIARTNGLVKKPAVLFRLNSFFSTEVFGYAHLSTGTICLDLQNDEYFVVASPACDLVARRPSDGQSWSHAIYPLTPIVAIRLQPSESIDAALSKAARGQHIFLEREEGPKAFRIVNGVGQPSYEFFFAIKEGRVREAGGKSLVDAVRIGGGGSGGDGEEDGEVGEGGIKLSRVEFEVVGQLRDMNATRALQLAGQHLSRIGLDFLDMPS